MDFVLKIYRTVPIIIFYDFGPFRGDVFGPCWAHFVRESGVFGYRLFFGGSNDWCGLAAILGKFLSVDKSLPFGSLQY